MSTVRAHLTTLFGEPEPEHRSDGEYLCCARSADVDGRYVIATEGLVDLPGHRDTPRELVMTATGEIQLALSKYLMGLSAHVLRGQGTIAQRYLGDDQPIGDPDFATICGVLLYEREELGALAPILDVPDGEGFRFLFAVPVLVAELPWLMARTADALAAMATFAQTLADAGSAADIRRGALTLP